jgi:hypothetical protein
MSSPVVRLISAAGGEYDCSLRWYDDTGRAYDIEALRLHDAVGRAYDVGIPLGQSVLPSTPVDPEEEPLSVIASHPATAGIPVYQDFQVSINGVEVPVYSHAYNVTHKYQEGVSFPPGYFGFARCDGTAGNARVRVVVRNRGTITAANVIPSRHGITTTISAGSVVEFTLPVSGGYIAGTNDHWRLEVVGAATLAACAVRTTANIATLSGEKTIDGVLTNASRVLVANQTNADLNGIYVTGTGAWTRATDAATVEVMYGQTTTVTGGTVHAGTRWAVEAKGSTGITWVVDRGQDRWLDITISPPADPAPVNGAPGVIYYTPGTIVKNTSRSVHAFGPGVYVIGGTGTTQYRFALADGDTIYLAPGALVYGFFVTTHASGPANRIGSVRMYGRGIIDGSLNPATKGCVRIYNCADVYIEGIIMREASGWTNRQFHNTKCTFKGYIVTGSRIFNNACSIVSCQNVEVSHIRVNGNDDSIELKAMGDLDDIGPATSYIRAARVYTDAQNSLENIHIHDCFIRSDVALGCINFGGELTCTYISNVIVEDMDFYYGWNRAVFVCEIRADYVNQNPHVQDLTFRRVHVERHHGSYAGVANHWTVNTMTGGGLIPTSTAKFTNVLFEDWYFTGTMHDSRFTAWSATNNIDDVTWSDIYYNGVKQTTLAGLDVIKAGNIAYITNLVVE